MPELPGGDILIIAGDLTAQNREQEYKDFEEWALSSPYKEIVVVPGNHDTKIRSLNTDRINVLIDQSLDIEGLKIYGSPWSLYFEGISPFCTAYTKKSEGGLHELFSKIPEDLDILVTHSPPYKILDKIFSGFHAGSLSLRMCVDNRRPKNHVYGHIHEGYGQKTIGETTFINASYVDVRYKPVNKIITLDI